MGTDEFMGVRPLGLPCTGEWYRMQVEVCGNRIRIFLNDEEQPHIDITDSNANLVPLGEIGLGGGWIETEFDDLTVTPMADNALKDVKVTEYQTKSDSGRKRGETPSRTGCLYPHKSGSTHRKPHRYHVEWQLVIHAGLSTSQQEQSHIDRNE